MNLSLDGCVSAGSSPEQFDLAAWEGTIADAISESDPVLSNLKITRCHYLLSIALQRVIGAEAGANFHSWAVWGSRKAGVTIRQEDLDQARRDGILVGGFTGALVGVLLGWFLMPRMSWGIVPVMTLLGAACGALTGGAIIVHSRRVSARLILEGNRTVLEDIGIQTARFVERFRGKSVLDPSQLNQFLSEMRAGDTAAGGQDLLKRAFAQYHAARFASDLKDKRQATYLANCLAVYHEHIRLEPYIKGSMPWIVRRCVTKRLLQFDIGPVRLAVAHDVPALDGIGFPESLRGLTNQELVQFLTQTVGCESPEHPPVGSAVKDWTRIRERMRYIAYLFRALHLDSTVLQAPYDASQLASVAAGIRPAGPL